MQFDGQIAAIFSDLVPLSEGELIASTLSITPTALLKDGSSRSLPEIIIPPLTAEDNFVDFEDEDGLHKYATKSSYEEFRSKGVHQFKFDLPEQSQALFIKAAFSNPDLGEANAELKAYSAVSRGDHFIRVTSSSRTLSVGEFVVLHAKTNFPLLHLDWIVVSKDIILLSGREFGTNIHSEVITFSVVVNSEMSPGFHVLVFGSPAGSDPSGKEEIVSDSIFLPVSAIKSHEIELKTIQIKDHKMESVELTCRGDPGAVFTTATMRTWLFPAQGIHTITKALLLKNLHDFGEGKSHVHRVFWTSREGETLDEVKSF